MSRGGAEHLKHVEQKNASGLITNGSVGQRAVPCWPSPHTSHSRRRFLARGLRGGILLAASPVIHGPVTNPATWGMRGTPAQQASLLYSNCLPGIPPPTT